MRVLLADARVDPAAEQQFALREACTNGHVEVVRLLLAVSDAIVLALRCVIS